MDAESAGNPRAVSAKGAIGCMQIMPATWAELTSRHALGDDPYDARMNMIAGALYLADLVARYGMAGAIAAYNAGPGRYERYAAGRARLPAETISYAARIGAGSARSGLPPRHDQALPARWQEAALFMPARVPGAQQARSRTIASIADAPRMDAMFPLSRKPERAARNNTGP